MSISYFKEILPCLVLSSHMKTLFVLLTVIVYKDIDHLSTNLSFFCKKQRIWAVILRIITRIFGIQLNNKTKAVGILFRFHPHLRADETKNKRDTFVQIL
jgi:hypothetical protein